MPPGDPRRRGGAPRCLRFGVSAIALRERFRVTVRALQGLSSVCRRAAGSPEVSPRPVTANGGQSLLSKAPFSGRQDSNLIGLRPYLAGHNPPSSEPADGPRRADSNECAARRTDPAGLYPQKSKAPSTISAEGARKSVDSVRIYGLATPPAQKRPSCEYSFIAVIVIKRARSMRRLNRASQQFFL